MNDKNYFDNINGYFVKDADAREEIDNIKNSPSGLGTRVSELETNVTNLETQTTTLGTQMTTLENNVTDLENNKINKSNFTVLNGTIENLKETTFNDPSTMNLTSINLPSGFTKDNSFVIGGEWFIYDDQDALVTRYPINRAMYSAKDVTSLKCSTGFSSGTSQEIWVELENYISGYVGYKCEVKLLIMKYETE